MKQRLTELDGLRGVAALAVVFFHFIYLYDFRYEHSFTFSEVFRYGYLGVHLFFMISGFVIFWSLSRCKTPLDFIWSRFSRLFPVYWVCVILTFSVVTYYQLPKSVVSIPDFLINLTMLQDFLLVKKVDGSYWSLSFELAFYFWILLVFCIGLLKHIEIFLIIWMCLAAAVTEFGIGHEANDLFHPKSGFLILFIVKYIPLFCAGICFYKLWSGKRSKLLRFTLLTSFVFLTLKSSLLISFIFASFYLVFFLIIMGKAKALKHPLLVYLGGVSYSLYLIHQYIGYVIIKEFYRLGLNPQLGILIAFLLSLGMAMVLTRCIEKPSLKFLRNIYKENKFVQSINAKWNFIEKSNSAGS